jgi:lysophospholipase L1-like esterase
VWRLCAAVLVVALAAAACRPNIPPAQAAGGCRVGIVGDSLTVGSLPYWEAAFASRGCTITLVNARSGRPTGEGVRVIELMAITGQLPDVLVVALGTNDPFDPRDFAPKVERVMAVVRDRPVLWVNIDKPVVEYTLNLTLNLALIRYDNLWVYDWNGFVDAHPEIRLWDQVHLTEGGYALRAALIAREVSGR